MQRLSEFKRQKKNHRDATFTILNLTGSDKSKLLTFSCVSLLLKIYNKVSPPHLVKAILRYLQKCLFFWWSKYHLSLSSHPQIHILFKCLNLFIFCSSTPKEFIYKIWSFYIQSCHYTEKPKSVFSSFRLLSFNWVTKNVQQK